jgi:hypothetical protein
MPDIDMTVKVQADSTGGFARVRGVSASNRERVINLIITPKEDHFTIRAQGRMLDPMEDWQDEIPLTREALWGAVQDCRKAWYESAVNFSRGGVLLLQNEWQLGSDVQAEILKAVASAGRQLFQKIFFPVKPASQDKYKQLNRIGKELEALTQAQSAWIRVTSDCFFAPWNLVYAKSLRYDGSDVSEEGFWGYRHLVEHTPSAGNLSNQLEGASPLQLGLQLDENIDQQLSVKCNVVIDELLRTYQANSIRSVRRNRTDVLAQALQAGPLLDHILYFCCHAVVEGSGTPMSFDEPCLKLTDGVAITPGLLQTWMENNTLSRCPIVFINACEGAQINSIFYQGFASLFLGKGASTVVGPQTEIPAVFAAQFARRFLEEFFKAGEEQTIGTAGDGQQKSPRTVGAILFDLRREFLDKYHNPLGLLYSVYRGADVFLPSPVPRA